MSQVIDTCGLSCPQPVLMFLTAAKAGGTDFEILVDNDASRENVSRAAANNGFAVETEDKEQGITLIRAKK
ncbi:MAG: sulfurtransferase TusA family protein [Desulfovibrionaceae bacterium]|nr:sulfurtransferase TusA family protein [Desulfovibrionaceae bacterium]